MSSRRITLAATALALVPMMASASAPAVSGPTIASAAPSSRYSLAHGCYVVHSSTGQAIARSDAPFRMQAAALGQYLLYGVHGDFIGQDLRPVAKPSDATVWRVAANGRSGFTITNAATGTSVPVTFSAARGCAAYPEAQVDATGSPFRGASPQADVRGTVEGHAHVTALELFGGDWHCGRPWSPYGAPYALPASCAADQQGTNGQVEAFVDFGGAPRPSDMHGWPTFREWPSPTALAEEGDYYTAIERAWKAGLRVMVTNLVDNEALCGLMSTRHNPCNDMASVRIQSHDLFGLQDYIDAQSGGPGKGWFRIVTDPFQARRVINQGKLAVIEGIEVSRIFGCGENNDVPQCDTAQVDAGLKEIHDLGVRTFFPVHEFDNAFGGTKMIGGDTGAIINAGNRSETGSFWTLEPCPANQQDAEQPSTPASGALAQLLNGPVSSLLHGNPVPVYGPGPQCNTRGLTALGAYLIKQMIKQHQIIQLDHMDSKTADAALSIAQSQHYAGVVSAHCCSSAQLFQRIYATGGSITEPVGSPVSFVSQMKTDKSQRSSKYRFGFGYGSDMNGLAQQPGPDTSAPIRYPFKSYDGRVTFTREQWGQRTFDLNTDGMANYGLYADWLQAVQLAGGRSVISDMFNGAEAYLEMWERASGVPATSCRPAAEQLTHAGLGAIALGEDSVSLLRGAGQPSTRPGRSYRYCVRGTANRGRAVAAVFGSTGRVSLVASTASGENAGAISIGTPLRSLHQRATAIAGGLWLGRAGHGGARYVYGTRGNRVSFIALASGRDAGHLASLRSDLRAAGLA